MCHLWAAHFGVRAQVGWSSTSNWRVTYRAVSKTQPVALFLFARPTGTDRVLLRVAVRRVGVPARRRGRCRWVPRRTAGRSPTRPHRSGGLYRINFVSSRQRWLASGKGQPSVQERRGPVVRDVTSETFESHEPVEGNVRGRERPRGLDLSPTAGRETVPPSRFSGSRRTWRRTALASTGMDTTNKTRVNLVHGRHEVRSTVAVVCRSIWIS